MTLYSTILCAIDFSDHSRRALRLALAIATRQRGRVVAVHAVDPLLAEAAATLSAGRSLEPDALSELNDLIAAERTDVASAPAVTTIVRVGPPAEVILDVAQENGAGLIAMGTQGLGGLRKLFFGSIAERVLRDAHVPAVAVPLPDGSDPAGVPRIREVIAAVEMDHTAEAIADHAATVAESLGLPLVLLHVVAPVHGAPRTAEAAAEATRLHEAGAQARLAELAARAAAVMSGKTVSIEIRSGPAAEEIAAAAAIRQALVTIASGGNDEHHRPGSIAYRVLCLCDLPVLAVPTRHAARG